MSQPEVVAKLRIDDSDAKKDMDSFSKNLAKIGAGIGAGAAIAAVGVAFKKAVDSASEAEIAVKTFNQALSVSGHYTSEASQAFQDYASSLQRTTGVSDELILQNSALLVSEGKLSGEGLKTATAAALDLAAGLQIDVGQAFDVVTKAANGNVGMLAKYGLEVQKGASDSEKFAASLEFINRNFAGAGASGLQGYTGAITKLSNAFGDVFEESGKLFTNSKTIRAIVILVAEAFEKVSDKIAGVGKSGDALETVFNNMIAFGQTVINLVLKPIEAISSFLATGVAVIVSTAMTQVSMLAQVWDKIFGTDLASSMETLTTNWQLTMSGLANETATNSASISDGLIASLGTFQQSVKEKAATISDEIKNTGVVAQEATVAQEGFFDAFRYNMAEWGKDLARLGAQVKGTFAAGLSNAFAQVGKTLIQGRNMFAAFGKAILSTLGNVAIQMGTFFITTGIAMLFTPGLAGQGGGLIAAGAALSILGGVLQAIGGGGAGGGVGATAAGTVPGGGQTVDAGMSDTALANEDERQRPTSGIVVNVQGNVLDRRQTGLELAQIINESFDTDGVTTRAVSGVV